MKTFGAFLVFACALFAAPAASAASHENYILVWILGGVLILSLVLLFWPAKKSKNFESPNTIQ